MKRIALVGYGRIAPRHVEALHSLGAQVVASCNRSSAGREAALAAGIPRTFARIDEMIEAETPDGVVCTAGFEEMAACCRRIFPHRLPTLIEKPPATSLADFEDIVALADQTSTPVMVGLNRRHYSVVEQAITEAGGLENIDTVTVLWSEDPQHLLRRFDRSQVEHAIFANSIHGLDLLVYLGGRIPKPQILTVDRGDLAWSMSLQGVSERGALCHFESTWDAPARWRLDFTVPGRRFVFSPLETCRVLVGRDERTIEPAERDKIHKAGFLRQAEIFLKMIDTRRVLPTVSLEAVRPAMELADALTRQF